MSEPLRGVQITSWLADLVGFMDRGVVDFHYVLVNPAKESTVAQAFLGILDPTEESIWGLTLETSDTVPESELWVVGPSGELRMDWDTSML